MRGNVNNLWKRAVVSDFVIRLRWSSNLCKTCRYANISIHCCDYLEITGRPRQLICPPGDACTVFKPRTPGRRENPKSPWQSGAGLKKKKGELGNVK